jgi:hypothetical protein
MLMLTVKERPSKNQRDPNQGTNIVSYIFYMHDTVHCCDVVCGCVCVCVCVMAICMYMCVFLCLPMNALKYCCGYRMTQRNDFFPRRYEQLLNE